jgi:hypothetical protein
MPREDSTTEADLQTRLARLAGWRTATRDDVGVAQTMVEARAVDTALPLSSAAFFDELFHYIQEIGAYPLLENLDPRDRLGTLYPFIQFVLFTLMRCVGGVQSMLATQELLLADQTLMQLLGFTAAQIKEGSTKRGTSRRKKPVKIRGPFSFETVADNIVRIGPQRLAEMFNGAIRCLAKQGMFPKQINAVLDATDNEATPTYVMDDPRTEAQKEADPAGTPVVPSVKREKRPDVRANKHARKIEVTVYGWKVWLVWEPKSQIPLALMIDGINVPDNEHARAVLAQARANVAGHADIRSVALDRGFMDGDLLSQIESDGTSVLYIPAKSNMTVTAEARSRARQAESLATQGQTLANCTYEQRIEKIQRGAGQNATTEERITTVVRIMGLGCDNWKPGGSGSAENSKGFKPKLVNATVVLRWDGAEKAQDKEVVLLDTDPSQDAFVGFDAYDKRSLIENTCNREAKEAWHLEGHPKRSEAGMRVQTYFVFFCMAIVAAFRVAREKAEEAEQRGEDTGMRRYRRMLEAKNRDQVAVFIGDHFGIYSNNEMLVLLGISVRKVAESAQDVLERVRARAASSA